MYGESLVNEFRGMCVCGGVCEYDSIIVVIYGIVVS